MCALHNYRRAMVLSVVLLLVKHFDIFDGQAQEVTDLAPPPTSPLCKLADLPEFRVVGVIEGKEPLVNLMIEHAGAYQVIAVEATGAASPILKGAVLNSNKVLAGHVQPAKTVWPNFEKDLGALFALPSGLAFVYKNKTKVRAADSDTYSPHTSLDPRSALFFDEDWQGSLYYPKEGFWFFRQAAYAHGNVWHQMPPLYIYETEHPNPFWNETKEFYWLLSYSRTLVKSPELSTLKEPWPVSWKWVAGYQAHGDHGMHHLYTDQGVYLFEEPLYQMPSLGVPMQLLTNGTDLPPFPLKVLKLNYSEHFACGELGKNPEQLGELFSVILYIPDGKEVSPYCVRFQIIKWLMLGLAITTFIMCVAVGVMCFTKTSDGDCEGQSDSSDSSNSRKSRSKSRRSERKTKSKRSTAPSSASVPSATST